MTATKLPEKIYSAEVSRISGLDFWGQILQETFAARELIWRLFLRDFHGRYRQSLLGYLWAIIMPLGTVGVFGLLKSQRIINVAEPAGLPYPIYVLLGLTIWHFFAAGLQAATLSLQGAGSLVGKVSFPREALVFAVLGRVGFDFLLRLGLVALVLIGFRAYAQAPIGLSFGVLFVPLALIPLLLLTLGLGFIFSVVQVIFRDTQNALAVVLNLLFFLVPILYAPPTTGIGALMTRLNPIAAIWRAIYELSVFGVLNDPLGFTLACLMASLAFVFGWRFFRLSQQLVAERV